MNTQSQQDGHQPSLNDIFHTLKYTSDPAQQQALLNKLKSAPGVNYPELILIALQWNPALTLSREDRALVNMRHRLDSLTVAKQLAHETPGQRICVFCIPKSGSSHTQSAIRAALNINFVALTSHAHEASHLGMNGREQELDELAIMHAIFSTHGQFVAQSHTRCHAMLCSQLKFFNIQPVVTVRNIFDAMVSADDMFVDWRQRTQSNWIFDAAFTLPLDYEKRPKEERLTILAGTFGIWALNFYLTWQRCEQGSLVKPLWLSYEQDIRQPTALAKRLTDHFGLDSEQQQRLATYVTAPNQFDSRINVGTIGRGAAVPAAARAIVLNHASHFRGELQGPLAQLLLGNER